MKHVDYVYTTGMTEAELDERLRAGDHGALALADGDDAYAVPLSYHYGGERLLLRISGDDEAGEKHHYLSTTGTATFLCYESGTEASWSVQVRGPIRRWDGEVDERTLNEWFQPFQLFDEAIEDVEFELYELEMEHVAGRRTVE